jgi:hypothetical protein
LIRALEETPTLHRQFEQITPPQPVETLTAAQQAQFMRRFEPVFKRIRETAFTIVPDLQALNPELHDRLSRAPNPFDAIQAAGEKLVSIITPSYSREPQWKRLRVGPDTDISESDLDMKHRANLKLLRRLFVPCGWELLMYRQREETIVQLESWLRELEPSQFLGVAAATPCTQRKRSTEKGEARTKIIAALTQHHHYDPGGHCENLEPIGVNELARQAQVAPASVSAFFDKEFGGSDHKNGHRNYKVVCRNVGRLLDSLRVLNGDFSPDDLYGRQPPGEDARDEDE